MASTLFNKKSLLVLGCASFFFSRASLLFLDEPEGPNLLVVTVVASILFILSLAVARLTPVKKLLPLVLVEAAMAVGLHFLYKV